MIICVSGGTAKPGMGEKLEQVFAELDATLHEMPGFISSQDVTAEDGEEINILRFETEEDLMRWRAEPGHASYMEAVSEYYESYWVQTAIVHREYIWRDGKRTDGDLSWMFRETTDRGS